MAKFVWRLQRVLEVKKKQEQAARMELLHLTEKVAQARCQLMMQQEALRSMLEGVAQELPKDRMNKQALAMAYAKGSQAKIKALEEQVQVLQAEKTTKAEALLVFKQTTEGLERLRANAKEQYMKDLDKKEQKMADELTLVKFARQLAVQEVSKSLVRE